jgi:hypothetical protein
MWLLTVLGQLGKAVLRFSQTDLRNGFSRALSTNRASSAWDDTPKSRTSAPASFPSFPIPLDPPPRSSIWNAIPSASFCSSKVPFLYQGDNPFLDWQVVVRHVEGMNRFVTSICEVMLVVLPSWFPHCLLHFTLKRTHANKPANCCC